MEMAIKAMAGAMEIINNPILFFLILSYLS